jgi:hemolysin III
MDTGEKFNSITHLVGAVFAVIGTAWLVVLASLKGDPWKITSFSIYGASLVSLYTSSALYHGFQGRAKSFFRKLDHGAIYFLIAGSYTPFTLVTLRGAWGWSIFGAVWGLAFIGAAIDTVHVTRTRTVPVVLYICMGWLALVGIRPMLRALPPGGFAWLLAGGIFYTVGIVFYLRGEKMKHGHGIWHLFVLAGSAAQFIAIFLYVL